MRQVGHGSTGGIGDEVFGSNDFHVRVSFGLFFVLSLFSIFRTSTPRHLLKHAAGWKAEVSTMVQRL
ncbi:hypothetical protein [Cupriavidus oxalaticus]|uniref:hypothetical protein n=1 Tax=Cupriavidus oxalaticus TaxID=96344 RepID=UPI003F7346D7